MKIDQSNYEEWLIRKIENDLNASEIKVLDEFLAFHPEYKTELEAFEKTVIVADERFVFTNKKSLYRDAQTKVVSIYSQTDKWWKRPVYWAAAASVIFLLATAWWLLNPTPSENTIVKNNSNYERRSLDKPVSEPIINSREKNDSVSNKVVTSNNLAITKPRSPKSINVVKHKNNKIIEHPENNFNTAVTNEERVALQPLETNDRIQFSIIQKPQMISYRRTVAIDLVDKPERAPVKFISELMRRVGKDELAQAFESYSRLDDKKVEISFNSHNVNLHKTFFENR